MSSITVAQAAKDLGIDEDTYRLTLEQFLPEEYGIIAEIAPDVATLVAKTFEAKDSGKSLPPAEINSSLSVQEQKKIINGANTVLTDFADCLLLDSHRISTALATIVAIKSQQAFDETFTNVFCDGINQSLQKRAAEVERLAQQLNVPQTSLGFHRANLDSYLSEVEKIVQGLNS